MRVRAALLCRDGDGEGGGMIVWPPLFPCGHGQVKGVTVPMLSF